MTCPDLLHTDSDGYDSEHMCRRSRMAAALCARLVVKELYYIQPMASGHAYRGFWDARTIDDFADVCFRFGGVQ